MSVALVFLKMNKDAENQKYGRASLFFTKWEQFSERSAHSIHADIYLRTFY